MGLRFSRVRTTLDAREVDVRLIARVTVLVAVLLQACGGGGDGGGGGSGSGGGPPPEPPPFCLSVGSPMARSVDKNAQSACSVAVTPGTAYVVSLTGLTDNANLVVSAGGAALCSASRTGTSAESCTMTAPGSALEVVVDGNQAGGTAAQYIIAVALAPVVSIPIAAGTSGPITHGVPTVGLVAPRDESRYSASGLTPGTHTVSISGLTEDADLRVFSDGTYSFELDCTLNRPGDVTNAPEDCTLTTGTDLFFSVRSGEVNRDGAGYVILVW